MNRFVRTLFAATLLWTYADIGQQGFIVSRSVDAGAPVELSRTNATTLTYVDATTPTSGKVCYYIQAYNVQSTSTAAKACVLGSPTNFTVVVTP
jgi:hypothetical protein